MCGTEHVHTNLQIYKPVNLLIYKSTNLQIYKSTNPMLLIDVFTIQFEINDQRSTRIKRWRGPRTLWQPDRWNNPDTRRRDVSGSPVDSVQEPAPSYKSESIREVPNFSSGNSPSNVSSVKCPRTCSRRRVWSRSGINRPLFWHYRKLVRTF